MAPNNSNSDYPKESLLRMLEKWDELVEVRNAVVERYGEEKHHKLLEAIQNDIENRRQSNCPPRLLLNLTPNKQKRVIETWDSIVEDLRRTRNEKSFFYELDKIKNMKSIDEIYDYLGERKNHDRFLVEEKNPKDRFPRIFGVSS
jgi:hypothetical protein